MNLFGPGAHGKERIPIVVAIAEGSSMFKREGQMDRQPVLYSAWKSNIWKRMNDALTVINTLTFNLGRNPMYLWRRNSPDKQAPIRDYTVPGGMITIDKDEEYAPLVKAVIDPSLMQVWEISQKDDRDDHLPASLGEPLGNQAPFSMVSMLSQAGRLPLVPYQKMASFAISQAMSIGLGMLKKKKKAINVSSGEGETEFDMADIPDKFNLTCNLEITMPQDKRQNVALAVQATQGESPLLSQRYALEEYLGVGTPDEMIKEIWQERFINAQLAARFQQMLQQLQMQTQAMMQPGQPGMTQPPMGQEQIPPEMLQQLAQSNQGAQPGLPGLPNAAPMESMGEASARILPGGQMPPEGEM